MRGITPFKSGLYRWLTQDCLLCSNSESPDLVCPACAAELPRLSGALCPRCAAPNADSNTCGRCLKATPHTDATRAVFRYAFPVDRLIQAFKYGHHLALGAYFGRQLASLAAPAGAELIVPLPLHADRMRERGFNQALELARPLAAAWRLPIDTQACRRLRHTPAQANLPLDERLRSLRGAFHCVEDMSGKHIVLVDDVMTSGASLNECARTLKLRGAASVTAIVVARALAD